MKDYSVAGFNDACNILFLSLKQTIERLNRVDDDKISESVVGEKDAFSRSVQATDQSGRCAASVVHEKHFAPLVAVHVSSIARFPYPGTCRVIFIFLDTGCDCMVDDWLLQSVTV